MAKSKRRILELETEMVENHAEILRLHKHHSNRSVAAESVPVINLNEQGEIVKKAKTKG